MLMIPLAFSFLWLRSYLDNRPIRWVTYSAADLDRNLRDGRTVLLNFRAEWHPTCVMHEFYALETPKVRHWIRSRGVVAMSADYTHGSPQIAAALSAIGQRLVPTVAIYPASSPDNPLVLSGVITEEQVLNALKLADSRP